MPLALCPPENAVLCACPNVLDGALFPKAVAPGAVADVVREAPNAAVAV